MHLINTEGKALFASVTEVAPPCLAAHLNAIDIGCLMLTKQAVDSMLESTSEDRVVPLEDFRACLEYVPVYVADPTLLLVRNGILGGDTYEEAQLEFAKFCKEPEAASISQRWMIVTAFVQYLADTHAEYITAFQMRFNDHTVMITDDGRIAIGTRE